jgi:hypothetical protein
MTDSLHLVHRHRMHGAITPCTVYASTAWQWEFGSTPGREIVILFFAIIVSTVALVSTDGALNPGLKRPECETDHSSTEVKNMWSFTFTPALVSVARCLSTGKLLKPVARKQRYPFRTFSRFWQIRVSFYRSHVTGRGETEVGTGQVRPFNGKNSALYQASGNGIN